MGIQALHCLPWVRGDSHTDSGSVPHCYGDGGRKDRVFQCLIMPRTGPSAASVETLGHQAGYKASDVQNHASTTSGTAVKHWAPWKSEEHKIDVFDSCHLCQLLHMKCRDKINNVDIFSQTRQLPPSVLVWFQQLSWHRHIIRVENQPYQSVFTKEYCCPAGEHIVTKSFGDVISSPMRAID